MPFKQRLNSHQTHMEDLVLLGKDGLDELNDKIEKFLNNKEQLNTTTKIDGAPAVICWSKFPGYPDNSIALKGFLSGPQNSISSVSEINAKYPDSSRAGMRTMLEYCLELAKYIPENEAWQGDCLFTHDTLKEREINGINYLTFQPNKIIYAFSEENPSYPEIEEADLGIAFHTIYKSAGERKVTQSFRVDPTRLNAPSEFYIMSPVLGATGKQDHDDGIADQFEELKRLESALLSDPAYKELVNNSEFMGYWNTFENANLADKKRVNIDINTFYNDLKDYVEEKQTAEYNKKLTTLKTDKGKEKALDNYNQKLARLDLILETNKRVLVNLVACLNKAADIKMLIWNKFKDSKFDYNTFYKSRTKGYMPANMEGIAMSDQDGNIVKIVDRSAFSSYNRDPDIESGFEHNESLEEALDSDTVVLAFGRMNPPTIGHQKLVDTMASIASKYGTKAKLYLSHTQDKKKNPLSYEDKIRFAKKAFEPKVEVVESPARTVIEILTDLYSKGVKNIVYVGGGDRIGGAEDISGLILKYNGAPDKKGNVPYKFDDISFENAGDRDEESDDITERASASLARKYVQEDDLDSFKEIVPFNDTDAEELFNKIKLGLGLSKLNENTFSNSEVFKHDGKYLRSVVNYILNNNKILLGKNGEKEVDLSGFLTPDIEASLKGLLDNNDNPVEAFNNIMKPVGIKWTNLYKGIHSGYTGDTAGGPGIGAEKELKSDKKIQEILKLVEPYLEDKYGDIKNIEVVNIEHTGGANSRRKVDFETLFNVSGLYDGVTSGASTSDKIADIIYKLNLTLENGKIIEEPIYISVKEGPTVSPINLGLSKTATDTIIDSLTTGITTEERNLLKTVISLRGTTIPGVIAIDNKTGDILDTWFYKFDQSKLDTENFKNAIINSYGNNYYYYHTSGGKTIQFKPVEEIIEKLNNNSVQNADLTVTQSRIVVQFTLGDLYCRLFIRRKGSTALFLLTEVLENKKAPIKFRAPEIKNLNNYTFKIDTNRG